MLEVEIVTKVDATATSKRRRLAGPFLIRANAVLGPGFTMNCEVLLRNLTAPCECDAEIRVISVR